MAKMDICKCSCGENPVVVPMPAENEMNLKRLPGFKIHCPKCSITLSSSNTYVLSEEKLIQCWNDLQRARRTEQIWKTKEELPKESESLLVIDDPNLSNGIIFARFQGIRNEKYWQISINGRPRLSNPVHWAYYDDFIKAI